MQAAEISRVLKPGGVFVGSTFLKVSAPLGQILNNDDLVRPLNAVRHSSLRICKSETRLYAHDPEGEQLNRALLLCFCSLTPCLAGQTTSGGRRQSCVS